MPVEIIDGALCLSGLTGTQLKTKLVESYYGFWLSVTTRGKGRLATKPVYIVDMNAATGLVKVEETGEIINGSAGHALERKYGTKRGLNSQLRIIFVESESDCREALFANIRKNWSEAELQEHKPQWYQSSDGFVDLFESAEDFLKYKNPSDLGNSLFYFDPLLAPDLDLIEQIASVRINRPFRINTEFLIFFFTSDWVVGRTNFAALPKTDSDTEWTSEERVSARAADSAFGGRNWVNVMKNGSGIEKTEDMLLELYKKTLRKWFRFVQPLPFVPKTGQRYDLFCCSNFDTGMRVINGIYEKITGVDFSLDADNRTTYANFLKKHPNLQMTRNRRSKEWKCLWHIMKSHIDGICDQKSQGGIRDHASTESKLKNVLEWLQDEGYVKPIHGFSWMWPNHRKFPTFAIDWDFVKKQLDVDPPKDPEPLKPEDLHKPRIIASQEDNDTDKSQTTLEEF
jgi:three-Cys-motif partner protein